MYHVLNRSVGKMHLFGKDVDFEAFQRVMIEAHQRHPIRILSYCVLSNNQGHLIALAGGTPRGLDRSCECAAEREVIRARAGEHREGPTFRRRRVG